MMNWTPKRRLQNKANFEGRVDGSGPPGFARSWKLPPHTDHSRPASVLRQAKERAMIDVMTGGDLPPAQFLE
jgi:hypothetical protein